MPLSIWAPPDGARIQAPDPVGVALLPDQPTLRHVGTRRVDRIDGGGEKGLAVDGTTHGSGREALAAQHDREIG